MKLAVLFGGVSNEHDVSCVSAASIFRNLDKDKYEIFAIGITKDGRWFYYKDMNVDKIQNGDWENEPLIPAILSPDTQTHGLVLMQDGKFTYEKIDCVFPVLHGKGGEDGTVQGLLELAKIPYVGCGVSASANSMDKSITKVIIDKTGVRQAKYALAFRDDFEKTPSETAKTIMQEAGKFPLFIKPCSSGSSVGISKANDEKELLSGLKLAFEHDNKVLVEEFIDGHEVECAVLGNRGAHASIVGEIAPTQEFYTFDAKYNDDSSALYIPAKITEEQMKTVQRNAKRVYEALGCEGLSRVDFFVTHDTGEIIFNEINTLPGFTNISMYPKLRMHEGVSYAELLDTLVSLALEAHHG